MSRTVSFRCSEELDEFLEQEAERRMTTKSTVAQLLLAEKVREMEGGDTGNGGDTGSDTGASEPVNTGKPNAEKLESDERFEMGSKDSADAVRAEFSEYLSGDDDKRFTRVKLREGTPAEVVSEVLRRQD